MIRFKCICVSTSVYHLFSYSTWWSPRACWPQQRIEKRGDETNQRTRAKPQRIVGQAYSHTYSTQSMLSRLQTICPGDSSKFRFTAPAKTIIASARWPHYLNYGAGTPISLHVSPTETLLSSMDSDLEAFSRNPPDVSIAVLVCPLTAVTKYLNELFLSY